MSFSVRQLWSIQLILKNSVSESTRCMSEITRFYLILVCMCISVCIWGEKAGVVYLVKVCGKQIKLEQDRMCIHVTYIVKCDKRLVFDP